MKFSSIPTLLVLLFLGFTSCKKDDDGITPIVLRDVTEVSQENDADLQTYLQTHFYNYEAFQNPTPDFDYKIVLDTIAGDNKDKTPLIDQVSKKEVTFSDVKHTLYHITALEGTGQYPTLVDKVSLQYKGMLLDGSVFDLSNAIVQQDMAKLVMGYRYGVTTLKTAKTITANSDGTLSYDTQGVGAFFMPSGLGYFGNSVSGIDSYSPLIFTVNLVASAQQDHDADGIPSELEDIDKDGNPMNDDSDGDGVPDFQDPNDDNDSLLTRDEIVVAEDASEDNKITFSEITFTDTDKDGIPDYLDTK